MTGAEFIGDAYLARGTGVWKLCTMPGTGQLPQRWWSHRRGCRGGSRTTAFCAENTPGCRRDLQGETWSPVQSRGSAARPELQEELIHISEFDKGTIYTGRPTLAR